MEEAALAVGEAALAVAEAWPAPVAAAALEVLRGEAGWAQMEAAATEAAPMAVMLEVSQTAVTVEERHSKGRRLRLEL